MNCCDYQCNQGRDCPARGKPFLLVTEEQDHDNQVAGLEAAARLIVQIAVAVVFFAAGFAFALWLAKGHVL